MFLEHEILVAGQYEIRLINQASEMCKHIKHKKRDTLSLTFEFALSVFLSTLGFPLSTLLNLAPRKTQAFFNEMFLEHENQEKRKRFSMKCS